MIKEIRIMEILFITLAGVLFAMAGLNFFIDGVCILIKGRGILTVNLNDTLSGKDKKFNRISISTGLFILGFSFLAGAYLLFTL
jgi:hypothetical protein